MISQRKIAESLGMPTSTVANILNGTPYYKKETRERVLKAAAELGYQRNRASIAIKRGRSNLVGVIYFGSYETGRLATHFLVQALNEYGYDYLVVDLHWHAGNINRVFEEMVQARVEGVLLIGNGSAQESFLPESLAAVKRMGVPIVSLYGDDYLDVPLVSDSSRSSFYAMTRHLQELGHRSILLPALPSAERSTTGRIEGFRQATKDWGDCRVLDEKEFTEKWPRLWKESRRRSIGVVVLLDMEQYGHDLVRANYALSKRLFASGMQSDAFMCANDHAALGVFNAAYEMKVRVPGDMAVTGADNDYIGEFPMFRLTTIRMDIERSSRATVEMLMELIKSGSLAQKECAFPAQLVLRQSCGRIVGPGEDETMFVTTPLPAELEPAVSPGTERGSAPAILS